MTKAAAPPVSDAVMARVLKELLRVDPARSASARAVPREANPPAGEASVETLHRATGLARGTVHNAITRLASISVLDTRAHWDSAARGRRGGKPTKLYKLSEDAGRALVLDFNHDRITAWKSDFLGNVHSVDEKRLDVDKDADGAIAAGAELLRRLSPASWRNLVGIGLSIPAPVDPKKHTTLGQVLPKWEDIDDLDGALREHLREQIADRDVPILADNDANLASLAEYRALERRNDPEQRLSNLVLVKMVPGRIGVGAGAIINGQQLRGTGFAMELGHLSMDAPIQTGAQEVECPHCRQSNCLQARVSTEALLGKEAPDWDDVVKWTRNELMALREARANAVAANDLPEVERLDTRLHNLATKDRKTRAIVMAGEEMGRALAKVATLLDPDVIALEGGLAQAWLDTGPGSLREIVGDPLTKTFEACAPFSREKAVSPTLTGRGENCARGAAAAVLDRYLIGSILKRVNSKGQAAVSGESAGLAGPAGASR